MRFLDGVLKTLRAIDLVQVDRFPIGQCVMVHGEDGLYDRGMIAKKIIECSESLQEDVAIYKVDLYNGSSRMFVLLIFSFIAMEYFNVFWLYRISAVISPFLVKQL